jgi:hypothetical protein
VKKPIKQEETRFGNASPSRRFHPFRRNSGGSSRICYSKNADLRKVIIVRIVRVNSLGPRNCWPRGYFTLETAVYCSFTGVFAFSFGPSGRRPVSQGIRATRIAQFRLCLQILGYFWDILRKCLKKLGL